MLRSTCPNHLILLVRSTTSRSWMPSFERRESELTSSFALKLQIQRIIARPFRHMQLRVAAVMAQVSAACSITLLTQVEYTRPLVTRCRLQLVKRGSSWRNLAQAHLQRVTAASSQHRQQRACPLNSKTLGQPQVFRHQPSPLPLFFLQ